MSCRFIRPVPDFIYHQYGICRMYSKRKSIGFPSSCSVPLSLRVSNAASVCRSCLQVGWPFLFDSSLLRTFLKDSSLAALPLRTKDVDIPYFVQNFLLALLAYMESAATASYPHIHELLLHADTVLQAYTFVESLEREVFDERYAVYLYVVDLRTELDGLCFLASYNGTYIMTVNADDAVPDLPAFKQLLFLYKNLSDDGKTLLVILGISE